MQNNMNTNGGLTTIEKLEKLSEVDIFSTLGPEELLVLARQCKEATFTPGECVFREGEMAMYIFCLVEGKMERRHPFGKTDVLEPGQSFGTLEALTRRPHHYTVTALEECRCLKLNHEVFLELIEERPPVATAILQVLGEKIWQFLSKIDDMEGRLAKYEKESVPL